jgi:NTE family protein
MHVVRLVAPPLAGEDHAKDIDFSHGGIKLRWQAGYDDTRSVLQQAPWNAEFDPLEGIILHEAKAGKMMFEG